MKTIKRIILTGIGLECHNKKIAFYSVNSQNIEKSLASYKKLDKDLSEEDLIKNGYIKKSLIGGSTIMVHPELYIDDIAYLSLLRDLAHISNMDQINVEEQISRNLLSGFIFMLDKHRKYRNVSDNTWSRLDTFVSITEKKKSGKVSFRHNGTYEGSLKYKNSERAKKVQHNLKFLAALSYGPDNLSKEIVCQVSGESVVAVKRWSQVKQKNVYISKYHLHHALHTKDGSTNKSRAKSGAPKGPASFMGGTKFESWSMKSILEFMGFIILSADKHDDHHSANEKGDIYLWLSSLPYYENLSLPRHWTSEENYNELLCFINAHCKNFDIDAAPTYNEFMLHNTLSENKKKMKKLLSNKTFIG